MTVRNEIIAGDVATIAAANLPWETLEGLNILVTGATGFIGAYLVETLAYLNEVKLKTPVMIFALARNEDKLFKRFPHLINRSGFVPVIQDVNDPWMQTDKIDLIMHAASMASPRQYLSLPVDTIKANSIGTINLLELAKNNKAKLLFLSSGDIYGNNNQQIISESSYGPIDPLHPRACYSESKRVGETLCMAYYQQFGVFAAIARISHTYGPGLNLDDGRVFTDLIADALAGRDIAIHGDGLSSRPFCYITDLIIGLFIIIMSGSAGQAYNIGAEDELSIIDLANLIIRISKNQHIKIKFTDDYMKNIRVSGHFLLDKIKKIGWQASVNPETGFDRMYQYYLAKMGEK